METRQATARGKGAVGSKAVLPRVVRAEVEATDCVERVLDFGAGPDRRHTRALAEDFDQMGRGDIDVQGYDLGDSKNILGKGWDVVFASNVLNVQSQPWELRDTLADLWLAQGEGRLLVNYPKEPRKMGMTAGTMKQWLEDYGWKVEKVQSPGNSIVWELTKRRSSTPGLKGEA